MTSINRDVGSYHRVNWIFYKSYIKKKNLLISLIAQSSQSDEQSNNPDKDKPPTYNELFKVSRGTKVSPNIPNINTSNTLDINNLNTPDNQFYIDKTRRTALRDGKDQRIQNLSSPPPPYQMGSMTEVVWCAHRLNH